MSAPKVKRNKKIVRLRKFDPETFTYRELSRIFKIDIRAVHDIYKRETAKASK